MLEVNPGTSNMLEVKCQAQNVKLNFPEVATEFLQLNFVKLKILEIQLHKSRSWGTFCD